MAEARGDFADPLLERAERLISAAVSRLLKTHPDTAQRLAGLEGQVIEVALRDGSRSVYAFPGAEGVRLKRRHAGPVAVKVSGRLSDFLAYARASRRGETLGAGRIEIMGDLAVAQRVQGLLAELRIDWEELLSRLVGDVPAHQVGRAARALLAFGREALGKFERDTAEYLKHELRLAVERAEVERFGRDAFRLADDVDRLEARLRSLAERRGQR
ncbi:MAG: SCP2 domain-containing protein [Gammaproteobacteria bacterium]